jgi:excisionase family DNA binding protein
MTDAGKMLTTSEYAKLTGVSVSTVTKMLRQGKLRGEKHSGKWAILPDQAADKGKTSTGNAPVPPTGGPIPTQPAHARTYDVRTFAQMTYLTEKGVRQWFRNGRLFGRVDPDGTILLDAANLNRPELRHLIR